MDFKWYEEVAANDDITQGDILINFPVVKINNYGDMVREEVGELNVEIETIDCIILTQACDIAQSKDGLKNIILCQIIDLNDTDFGANKVLDCIKGQRPQFHVLNKCPEYIDEFNLNGFNYHLVNFNEIETVPIKAVREFIKVKEKRIRLLPPYREHLSQAFAKYFMRIGLPSDINRDEIKLSIKSRDEKEQ